MAENISEEQRQLAEAMAAVQRDLAQFGQITRQTAEQQQDAMAKAKYGINNFTAGTTSAANALTSLAGAGLAAGKAMYEGKKGASAFNSALDELSTAATAAGAALALMIPGGILIKGLIAGITLATTAFIKYEQAANEMADKLHKGYQGLAKSGGAAADGMTGVFKDAKKLGLSMNELDQMVSLVADNSREFALFAGSVTAGRKQFADLSQTMAPARQQLMNMGMSMQDINEGTAGYLKLQTRLGQSQKMTTEQLASGAIAYLKEQDALTKLTGQSRQEMEQQRERALQKEQFAAKIQELRNNNQAEAAERLLKLNSIYEAAGPQMAAAFQASITGNLSNADAQKANLASNGELIRTSQLVVSGQMDIAEAAQTTGKAIGQTANTIGTTLGQFGAYNNTFGELHEQLKLAQMAQGDLVKNYNKILADNKAQQAGADKVTDQQSKLILTQMQANAELEKTVFEHIPAAQRNMQKLAEASLAAARALNRLAGEGMTESEAARKKQADEARASGVVNANLTTDYGMDFGQLSGADGGVFKGPESGYPVLMHGTEAIIPMDQMTNAKKFGNYQEMFGGFNKSASAVTDNQALENPDADKMERFAKAMLKDTEQLTKITDVDLKRTKNFSLLQAKLFEKKTSLMEDELALLDEQNEILEQMLTIAEKAGGKEAAEAMKKTFTMARMNMSGVGMAGGPGSGIAMPSTGSGTGLQMPRAANMPSMGGGQGLQITSQSDLSKMGLNIKAGDVQAEGAGISPNLIEMAKAIQAGVPGFGYFSAFNDKFHNEKASSSKHTKGLAADFTVTDKPDRETGANIVSWLKSMGASLAIDEYNNPSSKATAGHFHVEIPAFADGGDIPAGQLGIAGENGKPELITGPASVTPNNDIMGAFNVMNGLLAQSVVKLDDLLRAQKDNNDISSKMLRMQA